LQGTVGLLFSDIEGSTRLLQELGPAYGDLLLRHDDVMRRAFAAHGGLEERNEGDSFFAVFPSSSDAIAAALDAQLGLRAVRWPSGARVRVRMGIHHGEVTRVGSGLVGMAIHEAARIMSAAHGGQVLVRRRPRVPRPLGRSGSNSASIG
jgi:class 3 adenylate cyclase